MAAGAASVPTVALPERFDRRLRLGPFPSARDALKFVVYATAGALLAPFVPPIVWLPIVGIGFGIAVWRPEGQALDERAVALVLWLLRRERREAEMTRHAPDPLLRRGLLRLDSGTLAVVLRADGTPLAYLPPVELQFRFASFREFLREIEGGWVWSVSSGPLRPEAVVPTTTADPSEETDDRAGYRELVETLCRRRARRQIDVVLTGGAATPDRVLELERRADRVAGRLAELGIPVVRLRDRGLADAGRRLGWTVGGPVA